jgi:tetratricopeptide (TPR) repeat protein
MNKLFLYFLFITITLPLTAQTLDEELGFIYVKADYLMNTERYEDAIREFNKLVKLDPTYKDALVRRAEAKYVLGAYQGVKKDILEAASYNGLDPSGIKMLALADYNLENFDAALNSLNSAVPLFPKDESLLEARAEIHYFNDELLKACEDWTDAAALGSTKAKKESRKYCDGQVASNRKSKPDRSYEDDEEDSRGTPRRIPSDRTDDRDKRSSRDYDDDVDERRPEREEPEEDYVDLDAKNEIYVDEDLTLILKDGLGNREVIEQPNILILSDNSGVVSIDVCVSSSGRIESAEFNKQASSLFTQSIISLAVRKAKEFWFEKSRDRKMCGIIAFEITGRE